MAIEREETAGRGGPPLVSPPPSPEHPLAEVSGPLSAQDPPPDQGSGGPGGRG
jgi:hypothetical protein